jgi:hypothetical protein
MNRRRLSNWLVKGSAVISSRRIQKFSELGKKEMITYRHPNSNLYALPWLRLVEEGGAPKCGGWGRPDTLTNQITASIAGKSETKDRGTLSLK